MFVLSLGGECLWLSVSLVWVLSLKRLLQQLLNTALSIMNFC